MGEEDFTTVADDGVFYESEAEELLAKRGILVVHSGSAKYIRFVNVENESTLIKTDTLNSSWNIYLFIPSKLPLNADMTMMEQEYQSYFTR